MGCCLSSPLQECTLANTPVLELVGRYEAKVLDVYDGDTITVAVLWNKKPYQMKCRLAGINCPEIRTRDQAEKEAGLSARDFLRAVLGSNIVRLDCQGWDKYGRLLAEVYIGNESVNKMLLDKGYAKAYDGKGPR